VQLVLPGRLLLKEGPLTKVSRRAAKRQNYWFFLFSDCLLYAELGRTGRFTSKLSLDLLSLEVNIPEAGSGGDSAEMACQLNIMSREKSFSVLAASTVDRDAWWHALSTALEQRRATVRSLRTSLVERTAPAAVADAVTVQPLWIDAHNCCLCATAFSLLQRRHHCRKCGISVCELCSRNRMAVFGDGHARVCDRYETSYSWLFPFY
jgi:hypothetical protein